MHELKIETINFTPRYAPGLRINTSDKRIQYISDIQEGCIRHDKVKKDQIHDFILEKQYINYHVNDMNRLGRNDASKHVDTSPMFMF